MNVSSVAARLLGGQGLTGENDRGDGGLAGLASRFAAARHGQLAAAAPRYTPVIQRTPRYVERETFETREVAETRDVMADQAIEEERDVLATRDLVETRTVYQTRAVTETRAVYEDLEIREAEVRGTRSQKSFDSVEDAGIDIGAKFTVKVGGDQTATVTFSGETRITVTQNGQSQSFSFKRTDGSWRDGLVRALDSIDGLDAAFASNGRLQLTAGEAITLGRPSGGGNALSKLGLDAGITKAEVVGYNRVQTGTEQVVVGTEQVAVGTEEVVVGSETYVAGRERVVVGTRAVKVGEQRVVTGQETVSAGVERVRDGVKRTVVGLERSPVVALAESGRGGPDWIGLLFGALPGPNGARASEGEGRAAYGAAAAFGTPDEDPLRPSPGSLSGAARERTEPSGSR